MKLIIADHGGVLSDLAVETTGLSFPGGSSGTSPNATVPRDGWISFALHSGGLPPCGISFELKTEYTGTQGL